MDGVLGGDGFYKIVGFGCDYIFILDIIEEQVCQYWAFFCYCYLYYMVKFIQLWAMQGIFVFGSCQYEVVFVIMFVFYIVVMVFYKNGMFVVGQQFFYIYLVFGVFEYLKWLVYEEEGLVYFFIFCQYLFNVFVLFVGDCFLVGVLVLVFGVEVEEQYIFVNEVIVCLFELFQVYLFYDFVGDVMIVWYIEKWYLQLGCKVGEFFLLLFQFYCVFCVFFDQIFN